MASSRKRRSGKKRIVVALSGGVDSVVLLHSLKESAGKGLRAVHVHHGLSPNADAWADFVGWRINYEQAAYAVAAAVDAVPALWSGPRPHGGPAIAPIRPPLGRPPK